MDLATLKATYTRLTDPTADAHHQQSEVDDLRALLVTADPAWLAAIESELNDETVETFDPEVAAVITEMRANP